MLLFLVRSTGHQNTWTEYRGPWGRVIERNGALRYADGETAVPFLTGKSMDEAVRDIEARVTQAP